MQLRFSRIREAATRTPRTRTVAPTNDWPSRPSGCRTTASSWMPCAVIVSSGARMHRKTTGATGNERESPIDVVVGHNAGQADAGARCDTVRLCVFEHGINVFDMRAGNG